MATNNSNSLNILQWNCRSILNKIDRFKALIFNHNLDIFCLNETWLVDSKYFRIPQFKIIRKDRDVAYGGVLIGIRDNIEFKYLDLPVQSQIEYIAISIKKNAFVFSIICFYIPPNASFTLSQLKAILPQIPTPFLYIK